MRVLKSLEIVLINSAYLGRYFSFITSDQSDSWFSSTLRSCSVSGNVVELSPAQLWTEHDRHEQHAYTKVHCAFNLLSARDPKTHNIHYRLHPSSFMSITLNSFSRLNKPIILATKLHSMCWRVWSTSKTFILTINQRSYSGKHVNPPTWVAC